MAKIIDVGKVSARGQVAIPTEIREKMELKEGERILFVLEGDTLLVKRVSELPWEKITKPLHESKKRIKEEEVVGLIHRLRKVK